jgi:hypothetical protein
LRFGRSRRAPAAGPEAGQSAEQLARGASRPIPPPQDEEWFVQVDRLTYDPVAGTVSATVTALEPVTIKYLELVRPEVPDQDASYGPNLDTAEPYCGDVDLWPDDARRTARVRVYVEPDVAPADPRTRYVLDVGLRDETGDYHVGRHEVTYDTGAGYAVSFLSCDIY